MSIDIVLLIILIVAGICFFRSLEGSVYLICILDIFFRILAYVKTNLNVSEISTFINKYFPENIPSIIFKYTDGMLSDILVWVYVVVFIIFLFYIVRDLWDKR